MPRPRRRRTCARPRGPAGPASTTPSAASATCSSRRSPATRPNGGGTTLELLAGAGPVREKVRTLLRRAADAPDDDPLGCLAVNAMVEPGPKDERVAALLRADRDRRFAALRDALTAGRAAGEIAADKDPAALAHVVLSSINGLRVMARAGADRATLASVAEVALSAIRAPPWDSCEFCSARGP